MRGLWLEGSLLKVMSRFFKNRFMPAHTCVCVCPCIGMCRCEEAPTPCSEAVREGADRLRVKDVHSECSLANRKSCCAELSKCVLGSWIQL